MEGTRHEKAILIVAAYVIGFTSAFIAFGLSNTQVSEPQISFINKLEASPSSQSSASVASVVLRDDGLYLVTGETDRLLSAKRSILGEETSKALPGFFENMIDAEASRDGRFVYFCEQLTQEAENCDPYVYAVETDALYHVKKDGNDLYPIVSNHESMWVNDSVLVVNGVSSEDVNKPWLLFSPEMVAGAEEEVFVQ